MNWFSSIEAITATAGGIKSHKHVRNYHSDRIRSAITERGLLVPLDVLLVGATGSGKSSTLNAIFGEAVSKVGDGVDPETQDISAYKVHDYLRIHDSAGLGDGAAADARHARNITEALLRRVGGDQNFKNNGFMDLALVILDGGQRDLGTAFRLLESIVLKTISADRVIVAINQADMAMKSYHWNASLRCPEYELEKFLIEKAESVQRRIKESTGLNIKKPVCYSARHHWNLERLVDHVIEHIPRSRRGM
jgi:predicted GTPase